MWGLCEHCARPDRVNLSKASNFWRAVQTVGAEQSWQPVRPSVSPATPVYMLTAAAAAAEPGMQPLSSPAGRRRPTAATLTGRVVREGASVAMRWTAASEGAVGSLHAIKCRDIRAQFAGGLEQMTQCVLHTMLCSDASEGRGWFAGLACWQLSAPS